MNKLILSRTWLNVLRRGLSAQAPMPASSESAAPKNPETRDNMAPRYMPSEFQKTLLVWTKKYKSKKEIPKYVSPDLIERTRSEARIKFSNILILLTILGSIGAIFAGKAAAKRGESIHKMNQDFHKQYRENFERSESK